MNTSRSCRLPARRFGVIGAAAVCGLLLLSAPVVQAADVVARVDGIDITTDDLKFAAADFAGELQRIPEAQHRRVLIDVLVDILVLARAAEREALHETERFERRLAFLRARALRNAYFKARIEGEVTEADMRALYDREIAKLAPQDEIKASHILLATKEEAEAVIAELAEGKDFAELAEEKSTDPTAQRNGGDLGYFGRGRMVKAFEDAAFALEPGKVSAPVESQFGWHVIRLDDRRRQKPPAFEEVRDQIGQAALQEKYIGRVEELKKTIKVEILDSGDAASGETGMQ